MINDTLLFLGNEINNHLKKELQLSEDPLVVSPLSNSDGSPLGATEKKLVITLVNIAQSPHIGNMERGAAPLSSIVLNILLSANFEAQVYDQGLKLLSATMLFLERNPLLHLHDKKDGSHGTRLIIQMNHLNSADTFYLWGSMGARYLPSISYTIRTAL
jgi:hypothetical protein